MDKMMEQMYTDNLDQWILESTPQGGDRQALLNDYEGLCKKSDEQIVAHDGLAHLTQVEEDDNLDPSNFSPISSIIDSSVAMSPISNPTSPHILRKTSTAQKSALVEDMSEPIALIDEIFGSIHQAENEAKPSNAVTAVEFKAEPEMEAEDLVDVLFGDSLLSSKMDWQSPKFLKELKELEMLHTNIRNEVSFKTVCPTPVKKSLSHNEIQKSLPTHKNIIPVVPQIQIVAPVQISRQVNLLHPQTFLLKIDVSKTSPVSPKQRTQVDSKILQQSPKLLVVNEEAPSPASTDPDDPDWIPNSPVVSSSTSMKRKRKISEEDEEGGEKWGEAKRNQNKEAARRYRDKKKFEAEEVAKKRTDAQSINDKLRKEFMDKYKRREMMLDIWKELAKSKSNANFLIKFPDWMKLNDE